MTRKDDFSNYSKYQLDALNSGDFEKIFRELAYLNPLYYHGYTTMQNSIDDFKNELDTANEEVYNDDGLKL